MKLYDVTIRETLKRSIRVEAESRMEAEAIIEKRWKRGDYYLDAEDLFNVTFLAREEPAIRRAKRDAGRRIRAQPDMNLDPPQDLDQDNKTNLDVPLSSPELEKLFQESERKLSLLCGNGNSIAAWKSRR